MLDSKNGRRVPPKLRSLCFKLGILQTRYTLTYLCCFSKFFRLLVCLAVNALETHLLVTSVARDPSFMLYPLLNRSTISYMISSVKGFPGSKNPSNRSRPIILSTVKSNFSSGFEVSLLNFLRRTQISLRIFKSPLARHAGCYCPIFEPSMVIFEVWGHAPSVITVKK